MIGPYVKELNIQRRQPKVYGLVGNIDNGNYCNATHDHEVSTGYSEKEFSYCHVENIMWTILWQVGGPNGTTSRIG